MILALSTFCDHIAHVTKLRHMRVIEYFKMAAATKMSGRKWSEEEVEKLGCRSKVVESHCQLLSRWNSFGHRSVLFGYITFDFIQNNRKCIPCNTKVLIPLFTVKRTVSHGQYKSVIRIRPHTANSISWSVFQCYYRQHDKQQLFPSAPVP